MWTQNQLINRYPGAVGIKDGWTTLARHTMIAAAERDGHTVLVTLMGVPAGVTEQARTLLDWGFAHLQAAPVGTLVDPASAAVLSVVDGASPAAPAGGTPIVAAPVAVSTHSAAGFAVVSAAISGGALLLFGIGVSVGHTRRRLNPER
jgi:D-alanyl-D-alanine carboxypeptidase (penicillin-binding protein 5/6)